MKRNVLCHDYANIIKGDRVVAKALDGCGSLGSAHFGDGPHDGCVFLVARDVLRLDVSLFDVGNQVARNGGRGQFAQAGNVRYGQSFCEQVVGDWFSLR